MPYNIDALRNMNYEAEIRQKKMDTPKPPTYSPFVTNVTRVSCVSFCHAPIQCPPVFEHGINAQSCHARAQCFAPNVRRRAGGALCLPDDVEEDDFILFSQTQYVRGSQAVATPGLTPRLSNNTQVLHCGELCGIHTYSLLTCLNPEPAVFCIAFETDSPAAHASRAGPQASNGSSCLPPYCR